MKLSSINKVLRAVGLVMVIAIQADGPTRIWIERRSTFLKRRKVPL